MKPRRLLLVCVAIDLLCTCLSYAAHPRPNILCIVAEDINPHLGCFGDTNAVTPQLDRFAKQAVRYRNCWSTAPVCAPARTALITGVYPSSTGSEHMRSLVPMPEFMRMYPQILRQAGYYCVNNSKEDYNLEKRGKVWDESSRKAHWKNRKPGQPFFAAFNIEITHESQIRKRPHALKHDPGRMRLPAYHPDTPEVRHDWAQYYDNITEMDGIFGRHLVELEQAGLLEDTIVFFFGDNGSGMPRSKRSPGNSGLNVPLIVRVPERFREPARESAKRGEVADRLVSFVDFAPTFMSLAGIEPPRWIEGRAFLGQYASTPARYMFGIRGRMDERMDMARSVRNKRYVYIRNYMPHVPAGQQLSYMFETPTTRVWKRLYDQGKLDAPQTFFWETKAPEELYDLETDPDEVKNLATSEAHRPVLLELRQALREHLLGTRDAGFMPESERHRPGAGEAPYDWAHDPQRYPLERIVGLAEQAASFGPQGLPQFKQILASDGDSISQYWAAAGILIRGSNAVWSARGELRHALVDRAPCVRLVAAQALGKYGDNSDLQTILPVLRSLMDPATNSLYTVAETLAVIDELGPRGADLLPAVRRLRAANLKAPERVSIYIPRLMDSILSKNGAAN